MAGYAHADAICKLSLGVAARVRMLDFSPHWPGMPKGADISDWLAKGHTREELDTLIEQAPDYDVAPEVVPETDDDVIAQWLDHCILGDGKNPKPLAIVANALIAVRNDPALRDAFGYDEMLRAPTLFQKIRKPIGGNLPRPLTDDDVTEVQEWMQDNGLKKMGRETVRDAISLHAHRSCSYHPVRNYLDGLAWDGTPRLDGWLTTYLERPWPSRHAGRPAGSDRASQHVRQRQLAGCGRFLPHLLVGTAGRSLGAASPRPFSTVSDHCAIASNTAGRDVRYPVHLYHNTVQHTTLSAGAAPANKALHLAPRTRTDSDSDWRAKKSKVLKMLVPAPALRVHAKTKCAASRRPRVGQKKPSR